MFGAAVSDEAYCVPVIYKERCTLDAKGRVTRWEAIVLPQYPEDCPVPPPQRLWAYAEQEPRWQRWVRKFEKDSGETGVPLSELLEARRDFLFWTAYCAARHFLSKGGEPPEWIPEENRLTTWEDDSDG